MLRRLAPASVSSVPPRYAGVFAHGTVLEAPARLVFLAGQIGVDAHGETKTGFVEQTNQAIDNVEALLKEADLDRDSM